MTPRENKNPYSWSIQRGFHSSVVFDYLDIAILSERGIV